MEENLKRNFNLISLQHGALNFAAISLIHEEESTILFVAGTRGRAGAFQGKSNLSVRVLGKLALGEKMEHL